MKKYYILFALILFLPLIYAIEPLAIIKITPNNLIGNFTGNFTGNITGSGISNMSYDNLLLNNRSENITYPWNFTEHTNFSNISVQNNVSAKYYYGSGQYLTNLPSGDTLAGANFTNLTQAWLNVSLYAKNVSLNETALAISIADLKYDLLSDNATKWNAINSKLTQAQADLLYWGINLGSYNATYFTNISLYAYNVSLNWTELAIKQFNVTNNTIWLESLNKYNSSYDKLFANSSQDNLNRNWFDQQLNTSNSPSFIGLTLTGDLAGGGGFASGGWTFYSTGDLWMNGSLYILGNITAANVTTMGVNGSWIPSQDNMWDIGSADYRFRNGYFAGWVNATQINTTNLNGIPISAWIVNWSKNWTADAKIYADSTFDLLSDNATKWGIINALNANWSNNGFNPNAYINGTNINATTFYGNNANFSNLSVFGTAFPVAYVGRGAIFAYTGTPGALEVYSQVGYGNALSAEASGTGAWAGFFNSSSSMYTVGLAGGTGLPYAILANGTVNITGNTIVGNINATGYANFGDDVNITGNLNVTGNATIGNAYIGTSRYCGNTFAEFGLGIAGTTCGGSYTLLTDNLNTYLNAQTGGGVIYFRVNNLNTATASATGFNVTATSGINSTKVNSVIYSLNQTINWTITASGFIIWNGMNNISGNASGWYFA